MADEESSTATTDAPVDFATAALKSMSEEPEPQQQVQKEVKQPEQRQETKQEEKRGIPEELFGKKEEKEVKQEEVKSEIDQIAEPQFKDPKTKQGWDALKSKSKEIEGKYGEAQKRLAELEAKGKDTTAIQEKLTKMEQDYQSLQKQADEYRTLVQQVKIELDPEYRRTYVEGRKSLIDEAKEIASESGIEPKDIEAALNLKGKARVQALEEAMQGISAFQQGRIGDVISKLGRLDQEAEAKRSNPEDFLKQREEQSAAAAKQEEQQFREMMGKGFRDAMKEAADESVMLRKLDGVDWWNQNVDADLKKAQEFWENNKDPKQAAKMLILGVAASRAEQGFRDMRIERDSHKERADKAEAELAKLYGKGPRLGGGGDSKTKSTGDFASRVVESAGL